MKYSDLKQYHAYYLIAALWFVTWAVTHDGVYFPLGCMFLALAVFQNLKEKGVISKDANTQNKPDQKQNSDSLQK